MRLLTILTAVALLAAPLANARTIDFSKGWKNQKLSLFANNKYSFGKSLGITSDDAVSIAWTRLPQSDWDKTSARWNWSVDSSVPPTNLAKKGGDDRNISVYFVFLPESEAKRLQGASIRKLLGNKTVRVIQYAWGGNHGRKAFIPSPYANTGQGVTVALRKAGTGSHAESVNLKADYAKAFGGAYGKLVGMAVSADSDDTNSVVKARISGMQIN